MTDDETTIFFNREGRKVDSTRFDAMVRNRSYMLVKQRKFSDGWIASTRFVGLVDIVDGKRKPIWYETKFFKGEEERFLELSDSLFDALSRHKEAVLIGELQCDSKPDYQITFQTNASDVVEGLEEVIDRIKTIKELSKDTGLEIEVIQENEFIELELQESMLAIHDTPTEEKYNDQCVVIRVKEDFSEYLGLRYRKHSDSSGEALRDDHLIPALNDNPGKVVIVDLSGCAGSPARSFLEEVFGGVVRKLGNEIRHRIIVMCDEDVTTVQEADRYIEDALR